MWKYIPFFLSSEPDFSNSTSFSLFFFHPFFSAVEIMLHLIEPTLASVLLLFISYYVIAMNIVL